MRLAEAMAMVLVCVLAAEARGEERMKKREEIQIRDPFVLPVPEEGQYYLYGTARPFGGKWFDAYTSRDLSVWEGPKKVFERPEGFWGVHKFWAPEVHRYRGKYYLFGTFATEKDAHRGTQVLVSETPLGPYTPLGDGAQTPRDWLSLDGTLFIDAAERPWMVFCHEWLQVTNGEICAVRLSEDLSRAEGAPQLLFRAGDSPWCRKGGKGLVTDGPFLHRLPNGVLLMLWSTFFTTGKYCVLVARSASGGLEGPWTHEAEPLYTNDGGHAMIFRGLDGRLMMSMHQPNAAPERPVFVALEETETGLRIKE